MFSQEKNENNPLGNVIEFILNFKTEKVLSNRKILFFGNNADKININNSTRKRKSINS